MAGTIRVLENGFGKVAAVRGRQDAGCHQGKTVALRGGKGASCHQGKTVALRGGKRTSCHQGKTVAFRGEGSCSGPVNGFPRSRAVVVSGASGEG